MGRKLPGALACALVVALACAAALASGGAGEQPVRVAAAVPQRPNVVVILTDDMRADELRYLPKTNRLLVDQGVRFRNAISPHPLCCPARAGLFTGQYAQNNGVQHNSGPWGGAQALADRDANIGAWLTDAGYRTAYHGKFLNGWNRAQWLPRGWAEWDALVSGIHSYWRGTFYGGDSFEDRYVAGVMTRRSLRTIGRFQAQGLPFFSIVNHLSLIHI